MNGNIHKNIRITLAVWLWCMNKRGDAVEFCFNRISVPCTRHHSLNLLSRFSMVWCMEFVHMNEQMSRILYTHFTLWIRNHYFGSLFCVCLGMPDSILRVLSFVAYITISRVRTYCSYYTFFSSPFGFSSSYSFICIETELNFEIHHIECVVYTLPSNPSQMPLPKMQFYFQKNRKQL